MGAFIVILNWQTQHGGLKNYMLNCNIGEINGPHWSHSTEHKVKFLAEAVVFHKHREEQKPPDEEEDEEDKEEFLASSSAQGGGKPGNEERRIYRCSKKSQPIVF